MPGLMQLGAVRLSLATFVAQGDSITATFSEGPTYADFYNTAFVLAPISYHNIAVGGTGLDDVIAQASTVDALFAPNFSVLSIMTGTNNVTTPAYYPSGSALWLSNLFAYTDARRPVGFRVVMGTILPRADEGAGFETWRNLINNGLRANVGVHFDALVDYDLDPTLSDPTNLTYYKSDGLHPTTTPTGPPNGQRSMQSDFTPVCNLLFRA